MEIKFQLSVSVFIAVMLSLAAAVAVVGLMLIIAIPLPLRVLAALAVVGWFAAAGRRHALLRGAHAVRTVAFADDGSVEITANNGVWRGRLLHFHAAPLLTVFAVGDGNRVFNVLVAADSMPEEQHRQLRIRLSDAHSPVGEGPNRRTDS